MRVLLINPPVTRHEEDVPASGGLGFPLGLAYIAAVLEKDGKDIRVLDALELGVTNIERKGRFVRTGLGEPEIRKYIRDFNPDLVGITVMFTNYSIDAHRVATLVKEESPDSLVVFGGVHPSACPELVLQDSNVDMVVYGEGERTFLELANSLEKGDAKNVSGTIVRGKNGFVYNSKRPKIEDLDLLPFPARHLFPMESYLMRVYFSMRSPVGFMITSRGCPGRCSFCGIHAIWGHTWRGRSAKNVVDEIELMIEQYRIREVHFLDDNISANRRRLEEICNEIMTRKLDIKWTAPNGIAIYTLDRELLEKMKRSGCYRLTFGLESGSEETQRFIGKRITLDHARKIIDTCNSLGMWTLATFIIGFPYENMSSIEETIDYSIKSNVDIAFFNVLMPFPGTRVFQVFTDLKLLPQNFSPDFYRQFSGRGGGVDTMFFTKEDLKKLREEAYSRFQRAQIRKFMTSLKPLRKIRSFEDLRYAIRLGKSFLGYGAEVG